MKKVCVWVMVLMLISPVANATLIWVDNGHTILKDTNTGLYWYSRLDQMSNMTFDQQQEFINNLNNNPFYMEKFRWATRNEVIELFNNGEELLDYFIPSPTTPADTLEGRYGEVPYDGAHYMAIFNIFDPSVDWIMLDSASDPNVGGWVVAEYCTGGPGTPIPPGPCGGGGGGSSSVPEPATCMLLGAGLLVLGILPRQKRLKFQKN